ncbi:MAG: hypothetical protein R3B09_09955 [Nannocystaceae bacterium]
MQVLSRLVRRPSATPLALWLALSLASATVVAAPDGDGSDDAAEAAAQAGAQTQGAAPPRGGPGTPSPLALDARAREAFDAGDYRSAADAWARALGSMEESPATHMTRAVMLQNAIISYKQVYLESQERTVLLDAQQLLRNYLGECKRVYRELCEPQDETAQARVALEEISAKVDETEDLTPKRMPPEYNTVIGGKPVDVTRAKPPVPRPITLALVGGALLAGGGAALVYWGKTNPDFQPVDTDTDSSAFDLEDRADTDSGSDSSDSSDSSGGTSGGSTSSNLQSYTFSGEEKGKLAIGFGAFALAAGVGFLILGSIQLAKHRRINKRESTLAITPSIGPRGGGMVVQGRF